jgi:indole-3-glycerol phosphate synthase
MMTILDKIIAHKHHEIAERREQTPVSMLEKSLLFSVPRKSLSSELNRADKTGIIAEFKRRSPSKGWLNANADAKEITAGYQTAGASALSILTDGEFFGGSNQDLIDAFSAVEISILRKDFIVDEYQIVEAKAIGASAILLIAAALEEKEIRQLASFAASLGLEVLLEVHDQSEIPKDFSNIAMIGANNRNLKDFSVDVNRSLEIAKFLPPEITKISESGLNNAAIISELKSSGYKGFLIGETFMKTANPAAACAELIKEVQSTKVIPCALDFESET